MRQVRDLLGAEEHDKAMQLMRNRGVTQDGKRFGGVYGEPIAKVAAKGAGRGEWMRCGGKSTRMRARLKGRAG